ncbi:DNA endonuclease SmrA [Lacimicrobium sp. SS2-24]|uniref:DNA endonuclease SmrA n=1 Tax=Lacimicrobium sp. SS2-24 TaxID=2005569 RepID=UPI000B4A82AA|nr:DNA endonuclease SmrA [Lacimicrobium sp. SS2-24]
MQDVRPIASDDKVVLHQPATETLAQRLKREALEHINIHSTNPLSTESVEPVAPYDYLEFKKAGVQEGVYKKLRLGKYLIDDVLNMQRMSVEQARKALFETIMHAHQRGLRTLLIQHGLGLNSKPIPALIKSYVNQWLRQLPVVLAYHTAQKQHGGMTATYVLLQKNQQQKQINRERHQKPK